MTIVNRVRLNFGLLVLIVLGMGLFSLYGVDRMDKSAMLISQQIAPLRALSKDAEIQALEHRRFEKDFLINIGNPEKQTSYLGKFAKASDSLGKVFARMDQLFPTLDDTTKVRFEHQLSVAKENYQAYHQGFETISAAIQANPALTAGEGNKLFLPNKESIYKFETAVDSMVFFAEQAFTVNTENAMNLGDQVRASTIAFGILALALFASIWLTLLLRKGFAALIVPMEAIVTTWDLRSLVVTRGQDEMAVIGKAFNDLIAKLRTNVSNISESTHSVSAASEEFSNTAAVFSDQMGFMGSTAREVRTITEKAGSDISGITVSVSQLSGDVSTVASAIEELNASISAVSEHCRHEAEEADKAQQSALATRNVMTRLSSLADQVSKVVDLIGDIAAQTNLLALNATIEAATAGEAGKGFAVVAGEVKDLAKQTAKATDEISTQVDALQKGALEAMNSIEAITQSITNVHEVSNAIFRTVQEQSLAVHEVSRSVSSASNVAKGISKTVQQASSSLDVAVDGVRKVTQAVADGVQSAQTIQDASKDLAHLAANLKNSVQHFRT